MTVTICDNCRQVVTECECNSRHASNNLIEDSCFSCNQFIQKDYYWGNGYCLYYEKKFNFHDTCDNHTK